MILLFLKYICLYTIWHNNSLSHWCNLQKLILWKSSIVPLPNPISLLTKCCRYEWRRMLYPRVGFFSHSISLYLPPLLSFHEWVPDQYWRPQRYLWGVAEVFWGNVVALVLDYASSLPQRFALPWRGERTDTWMLPRRYLGTTGRVFLIYIP